MQEEFKTSFKIRVVIKQDNKSFTYKLLFYLQETSKYFKIPENHDQLWIIMWPYWLIDSVLSSTYKVYICIFVTQCRTGGSSHLLSSLKEIKSSIFILNAIKLYCIYVCLEFIVPLENFSLIWRRHHCRWKARNFDLYSAFMAIEQWGFFLACYT